MLNEQKVALFVPNLAGGGAERVIVNLAHAMLEFGLSVDLLVASGKGPFANQLNDRIKLINFQTNRTLNSFPQLVNYLRRNRPKALISALSHCNVMAIVAKKVALVNTRVVVSEHIAFGYLDQADERVRRTHQRVFAMMRLTYPFADAIVTVSQGVADDLRRVAGIKQKPHVIFNPVLSKETFRKADLVINHPWLHTDIPVIVAVGRLERQKDFTTLLKAFALLRNQRPARLMILGEGTERSQLEALIRNLEIVNDVWLPGFIDNPYPYMKHADLFVLSSIFEGLPTVLIEAMAVGTPVVATDCQSGPKEIFNAAHYGTLIPVQDPQGLAEVIHRILSLPRKSVDPSKILPYTVEEATKAYMRLAGYKIPEQPVLNDS
jgi:glycosyltransferase involved in cell wall biosynthesis